MDAEVYLCLSDPQTMTWKEGNFHGKQNLEGVITDFCIMEDYGSWQNEVISSAVKYTEQLHEAQKVVCALLKWEDHSLRIKHAFPICIKFKL